MWSSEDHSRLTSWPGPMNNLKLLPVCVCVCVYVCVCVRLCISMRHLFLEKGLEGFNGLLLAAKLDVTLLCLCNYRPVYMTFNQPINQFLNQTPFKQPINKPASQSITHNKNKRNSEVS